jgi:polyhydroxyalkanoate synthesis regulator phasin
MVDADNISIEQTMQDPSEVYTDQREVLQEIGMTEEEAEKIYKDVKTQIMLASQEAGQKYSQETINALTNVAVASQKREMEHMRQHPDDTITINLSRVILNLVMSITLLVNVIYVYNTYPDLLGFQILNVLAIPVLLYWLAK